VPLLSLLGTYWFISKTSISVYFLTMSKTNLISLLNGWEKEMWLEKEMEKKGKQQARQKP